MSRGLRMAAVSCGNQSRQAACACAATSPPWLNPSFCIHLRYFLVLLGTRHFWVLRGDSTHALASKYPRLPLKKCCYCAFLLIWLDILAVAVQLYFSHLSAVHDCYTLCVCVFVCLCLFYCVFVFVSLSAVHNCCTQSPRTPCTPRPTFLICQCDFEDGLALTDPRPVAEGHQNWHRNKLQCEWKLTFWSPDLI